MITFLSDTMRTGFPAVENEAEKLCWFVMRDLKRSNARQPAYKLLEESGIEFFTPMVWKLVTRNGKRIPQKVPFMQDLLFVHDARKTIDPIVARTVTFQYRYLRGGGSHSVMTVRDADMERFKKAVESAESVRFYLPGEITPSMVGRKVRIVGGVLDGYEGRLQKLQGSKNRRLFVEIPDLLTAAVEVRPEYIRLLK